MEKTLGELAEYVGGKVKKGDKSVKILGVKTMDEAEEGYITFLANEKYEKKLNDTAASAVIVSPKFKRTKKPVLVSDNPYLAFAKIVDLMMNPDVEYSKTVHETAVMSPTAELGKDVSIYPHVYVGERVKIGNGVVLMPKVFLGDDCEVGDNTIIHPNVVIYANTRIGNNVAIHANSVIGSGGFGYAPDGSDYFNIPQVGKTILEDDVVIGDNTTIQRGALGATRIGRGTKIGSQCQIAHNVEIGSNTLLIGQIGIAGTAKIGSNCVLAGGVGVVGHVTVGDRVTVGARSGVTNDLPSGGTYLGYPAVSIKKMRRAQVATQRMPKLMEALRSLRRRTKTLEDKIRWKKKSDS
ncbi:MAG: UDP-3-O-(3-hydroxymyristoyl)glucosamine N-acyltransferase [Planctomycetes bacterium]|nr:UDP-3-O-(3-hydroxymyristoyl)glucosamine N-acyltransferase [Planctomycetota bacterium]